MALACQVELLVLDRGLLKRSCNLNALLTSASASVETVADAHLLAFKQILNSFGTSEENLDNS